MRSALSISLAMHSVAIVVAYVGLPQLFEAPEPIDSPIVVELVTIAEKTVAVKAVPKAKPKEAPKEPPKVKPEHKPKAAPKPPPKPKPVKVAALPPEPVPQPAFPEPEPALEPVAEPLPKPKPEPKPEVKPEPKPEKKVVLPLKPRWKPKAPPRPKPPKIKKVVIKKPPPPKPPLKKAKPKKKFDPTRIAALLDKAKKEEAPVPKKVAAQKPLATKSVAVVSRAISPSDSAPMTISEVDAVRYKIEKCWIVPAGARDAEDLVVRIRISLNPDGSIRGVPEILDQGRMSGNGQQFYKIAAEGARRAVLKCQPYDMLPRKKYERWREIELTFNPKEMLGG